MNKPLGCWKCEQCESIDPETNMCKLDSHTFADGFALGRMRDVNCPLDNGKMSKEYALEVLQSRKEHYEMGDGCEELVEALDMAIKSLKKEMEYELFPSGQVFNAIKEVIMKYINYCDELKLVTLTINVEFLEDLCKEICHNVDEIRRKEN